MKIKLNNGKASLIDIFDNDDVSEQNGQLVFTRKDNMFCCMNWNATAWLTLDDFNQEMNGRFDAVALDNKNRLEFNSLKEHDVVEFFCMVTNGTGTALIECYMFIESIHPHRITAKKFKTTKDSFNYKIQYHRRKNLDYLLK